jgi:hypothetical protein
MDWALNFFLQKNEFSQNYDSITTLGITTLSIMDLTVTRSLNDCLHKREVLILDMLSVAYLMIFKLMLFWVSLFLVHYA